MESYGLPTGSNSNGYGGDGVKFPDWVYQLGAAFELRPSTYPGHQEKDRRDIGAAPNPDHLNRGIDWVGPNQQKMLDFAHWLRDTGPARTPGVYGPAGLEMVIYQDPRTGERVGYPSFVNYGGDYPNHTNHVHTRHSASMLPPGQAPPPPPAPASDAADVLARATGITLAKAQPIVSQVSFALTKSNCTNPRRIAAALAQWVVESGHFVYTEEIADGPEDQERWKYKGRTWIQLTWLENYLGFSRWCHSLGLVPSPTYFGDRPRELAEQKWAALGPAYWWAVKYPQINEYADRGDIDNVSKWVNAPAWVGNPNRHANGEKERRDAYNRALALGDQLLVLVSATPPPPTEEDELSAEAERMIRELYDEYQSRRHEPTRSFFATSMLPVESPLGFMLNTDGNVWDMKLTWAYLFGVTRAVEYVERVASEGVSPESWAATVTDEEGHWLTEFGQQYCQGLIGFRAALQAALLSAPGAPTPPLPQPLPVPAPQGYPVALSQSQQLEILNAARDQLTHPLPVPVNGSAPPASTGEVIGKAYDALNELRLADALPIESRAPLAALIAVLQTKNGSDLGAQAQ